MIDILIRLIACLIVISTAALVYVAGYRDGQRQQRSHRHADNPIQMEHTHGGEEE